LLEGRTVDVAADGFDHDLLSNNLIPSGMIVVSLGQAQRYSVAGTLAYLVGKPASISLKHQRFISPLYQL